MMQNLHSFVLFCRFGNLCSAGPILIQATFPLMFTFYSASARIVDSKRAIADCLEAACGDLAADIDLLVIHASVGHDFQALAEEAAALAPRARVVGASCCGVVGSEGVSESLKDIAIMAVRGPEFAVAHVDNIRGHNSTERARSLAADLKRDLPLVNMAFFMASGIDIDNDACIAAIERELGPEVTIFGATSADNMRGVSSHQIHGTGVFTHSAWLVGFADPTLAVDTQASHGFIAIGDPLLVTRSEGNLIRELNGRPAWAEYTRRLGLPEDATCADTIPIGALAEELPEPLAAEYGNRHILRVITKRDDAGAMHYPAAIKEGVRLWLTLRDEQRIFDDLDRMMRAMLDRIDGSEIAAVFHADCLARGRHFFHRILKEELVSRMQQPLAIDGLVPPWLGMYGFGEFARLGGRYTFHNYPTAIYTLDRRQPTSA
jgi:hypothetical protein